jgi:CRP/FNR family transcriptional regulator, cyclic AMP receptor protein
MTIENLEPSLAEHPFFQGMKKCYLQLVTDCAKSMRFEAGELIFREGEFADLFYLIRHGKVALEIFIPERGSVPILSLGTGDALGWSWLSPPYKWRFDARAIETTLAFTLDGKCLDEKCDENPKLGYDLLKTIATLITERLHATRLQMLDVN